MTDTARLTAALADRYRIERELGQGGMATVYLAHDVKHDRKVAIKVLKPELAAVLGADRFVQEIKTTAQLQHPHILPLFDSGTADGFLYYVMPYIQGETLRAKLDREKQLGIDESVRITTEVADALDYAHRHGVVHRDIKPENILLHDGRPMVADFGIALAVSAAAGGRMTETGLSLGTPHYMSPEQATADRDITARSDIYSLASVLYEMLTGQPPHLGGTAQQVIMKIIAEPVPAVTTLRKAVPPNVAAALAQALEKLPADRFATAQAFSQALTNRAFTTAATLAGTPLPQRFALPTAWTAAVMVLLAAVAAWGWLGRHAAPATQPAVEFYLDPLDTTIALDWPTFSPDGRRIAAHASTDHGEMLYQRSLDSREWHALPGTEGAMTGPAFSPDGKWLLFGTADGAMKRIPVDGGAAQTITQLNAGLFGATWGPDNTIVYSTTGSDAGGRLVLLRVPADGGTPQALSMLQSVPGSHVQPHFSADGQVLFFEVNDGSRTSLMALSLRSGKVARLGPGMTPLTDGRGRVTYVTADGLLMVQGFNARTLALEGSPRRVADGLSLLFNVVAEYTISPDGALAYVTGASGGTELLLVDRTGKRRTLLSGDRMWGPRFSPSGDRIAFLRTNRSAVSDLWVYSLADGTAQRLTTIGTDVTDPAWTHDGRWIGFSARERAGSHASLFRTASDGSGSVEPLLSGQDDFWDMSFGRGDREAVFWSNDHLLRATFGTDSAPVSLVQTSADLGNPALSADGRWIAYESNETGVMEIYVQPFPDKGARTVVSVGGGRYPAWSADGREIIYWGPNRLMAATVRSEGSRLTIVQRTELFDTKPFRTELARDYDVRPDGRAFVMLGGAGAGRLVARIGALDAKVP